MTRPRKSRYVVNVEVRSIHEVVVDAWGSNDAVVQAAKLTATDVLEAAVIDEEIIGYDVAGSEEDAQW